MSWLLLKKSWDWCKIHWKFVLGITIPIVVSIILRKGNVAKVYRMAAETKDRQLKALAESNKKEIEAKQHAQQEFIDATKRTLEAHDATLKRIAENEKKAVENIDTPEKATQAIIDKLEK